jgi:uncharacterized protein
MIAVDSNILIYAHREDSQWHEPAREQLTRLITSSSPWAITWPSVHEFLAIVTSTRAYRPPTPLEKALGQIEAWMESPLLHVLGEPAGYWPELKHALRAGRITGAATHDARIFAICRLHGVRELWSADRDFSRFKGIRIVNPLIA